MALTTHTPPSTGEAAGRRIGRALETVISIGATGVFAVLWIGFIIGLATGGELFTDAWTWLMGLEPVVAVVVWVLFLPICVGLWAWVGGVPTVVTILVAIALLPWTALAFDGLRKVLARR